eukprot:jgi/Phyca11/537699/estExt2_fgenesh1_pg.C_PHYCAscaffold_1060015
MAEKPPLPRMDSMPPVSARDASYWLAVASAPSSSRSGAATIISTSSSTRSLDANSFLLSIRSNSSSSSFLDVASGRQSGNKSLLELRNLSILHNSQPNEAEKPSQPLESDVVPPPPSSLYDSSLFAPKTSRRRTRKQNKEKSGSSARTESKRPVIVAEEVFEHQRYQMRRLLSAEAMALDGSSFQDNLGGISHAHGGAVTDDFSDEEDYDDQSESSSSHGQRRSSSNGGDVLRLWASLHAKPGGVLSAVSSASPTLRSLLRACDQFLASLTMRQHIASFLVMFRQKYEQPSGPSVTAMGASAWTRLSEPWAPVGVSGNESDSDQEIREGSLGATPQELQNVTTLQDARSLLALKNYRFFLERSLEMIMEHLADMANPSTPRQLGDSALNGKRAPTDDEWALARRAALYKLERRTFIPLQEIITNC